MKQWLGIALGIVTAVGGFLDAGTVVTAGQAGARFGLGLIWAVVLGTAAIILLVEMVGRFTAVSGRTYAQAVREHFGFKIYLVPLTAELVSETVLLAAEIGGIAIAFSIATGIDWHVLYPLATLFIWFFAWRAPFDIVENGPALLGLTTLSFLVAIVALGGPPPDLLRTLWHPPIGGDHLSGYLALAAAILGATISPYLLYFYSSGAREDDWGPSSLELNRVTAVLGMGFGSLGSIALMVLAALVLRPAGLDGGSLQQLAATMERPFGLLGRQLFAVALFSTCTGAALEVSLALAYNISQGFGWTWGENRTPVEAPRFNLVLSVLLAVALVIGTIGGDPVNLAVIGSLLIALFLPASLSPFLVIMNDRDELGKRANGLFANLATAGILCMAFVVALASVPLSIMGS